MPGVPRDLTDTGPAHAAPSDPRPSRRGLPGRLTRIVAVAAAAATLLGGCVAGGTVSLAPQHNIVVVVADDLDVAALARLPVLRHQLADRGTTFTRFFTADSLCCPSRASILRGQYVHNHGVLNNLGPHGGYQAFLAAGHERSTVATWLNDAGYRTALAGKYMNAYPLVTAPRHVPPGWDEWYAGLGHQPYGQFDYRMLENGREISYGHRARDYGVDVLSRKATAFVRSSAERDHPFFLYLAPYVPHLPATPAPRYRDAFRGVHAPRTPSFGRPVTDAPRWQRALPRLTPDQTAIIDRIYRKRLASMLAVQDMVSRLIATLRRTGQLDETYLMFTSDNGYHLGQHRLPAGKRMPYEEDIQAPLIVRGPGVAAGRKVRALATNVDLGPTLAELAGAQPPPFVDGRSLVPLIQGERPDQWRRAVLFEHFDGQRILPADPDGDRICKTTNGCIQPPRFTGMRTDRYTYVEYATGARELYDLRRDPHQLHNLAATADPALLRHLSRALHRLAGCRAGSCRVADRAPHTAAAAHVIAANEGPGAAQR
ncbi:MAG: sulfatase family protein [Carbonactinosporaceae bacterium]